MTRTRSLSSRGLLALVAVGTALALVPSIVQAEPRRLAVEQRATDVAAWNGSVVWSSYDTQAGVFRLVVSHDGGAPQALPIAPSPVAFDVDLGTNRSGATYAVYSRCTGAPTAQAPRGTGCDLYRLSLATGRETRLTKLSSPRADERDPTILAGRVAFIRRERYAGYLQDVLRVGDTTSGSHGTTILARGVLRDPELSNDRVAYVKTLGRHGEIEEVHVRTLRAGRDKTIYRAKSGGANSAEVTGPSVDERLRSFVWARTNLGSGTGNRLVRYSIASGRLTYATGNVRIHSTSWAGAQLGMAYSEALEGTCNEPPSASICSVSVSGPLTFDARP